MIWSSVLLQHHDIRPLSGDQLLYIGADFDCPEFWAGTISLYDRRAEQLSWYWSLCDHYLPTELHEDWAHLNTIEPFPNENAVLVSSRNQSSLFKVVLDTEEIASSASGRRCSSSLRRTTLSCGASRRPSDGGFTGPTASYNRQPVSSAPLQRLRIERSQSEKVRRP